ncbi:MAG: extracellular solute-binding protein [Planctomycetota bacterium]|nr:extracellular solute-binding protein [Planctomycetota bacterium]
MRFSHLLILILVGATLICIVPPPAEDEPELHLRMAVWGMPFEDNLFRDIYAREFARMHPGLQIKYEKYVDVTDKYLAWHILGTGADVMRVPITDYHTLVSRGVLEPIDGYLAHPEYGLGPAEQTDFMPALWDALLVDGQRYALPSDNAQYGLYYNRTIFDRYNEAHPADPVPYPDGSWTWNDLHRAAEALTVRDARGRIVQYGFDLELWPWPFMAFLAQAGGKLWDEDQTTTLIDSEAGVEALAFLVEMIPHAGAMRSADVKDSATGPDKLFAAGQTAMLMEGSWRAPYFELINPDLDFAVAPLPSYKKEAIVSGSVLWAVSAHSDNKELAWRMIRWMTDFEQSMLYWKMLRVAPPARLSVIRSPEFRQTPRIVDDDGRVLAPGMPRENWVGRGAWLRAAITPDPETGEMPGFVPVAPYQKDLEEKINAMLSRATAPGRTKPLRELLEETAEDLHRIIDRDRRARGLPPVKRSDE